jgi:hypothetical protein
LTHIIQVFDARLASPLKVAMKKILIRIKFLFKIEQIEHQKISLPEKSYLFFKIFLEKFQSIMLPRIFENVFRETGISPINPEKFILSPYVFNDLKNPRHSEGRKVRGRSCASTFLTDDAFFWIFKSNF